MAVFQNETGVCTGRGFADTEANGIMAKFKTWVVKAPAAGGPNWYILFDRSTTADTSLKTFTVSVTGTSHVLTSVAHGFVNHEIVFVSNSGGTLPGGLAVATGYYIHRLDADTFRLCSSMGNSDNATGVNVTNTGSGTHSCFIEGPYIIVCDQAAPTINQACKVIKAGYSSPVAGQIRFQIAHSFDTTNKIINGFWGGYILTSVDGGDFVYDFRGGAECMVIHTRVGSTWYFCIFDNWTGDANLVEGTDKRGIVLTMTGNNLITFANAGEASNFTLNNYYYITDFQGHYWSNHVKVTNVDVPNNQVTITESNGAALPVNFPAGAIIAAYEHRFYCMGNTPGSAANRFSTSMNCTIPYMSGAPGACFGSNDSPYYTYCQSGLLETILGRMNPGDDGSYAVQRPLIIEFQDQLLAQSGNRAYGLCNNLFATFNNTLATFQDGRTIGTKNYIYIGRNTSDVFYSGGGQLAALILDTTSLT